VDEAIAGFLVGPKIVDATDKLIEVKAGQVQTTDKLDNPTLCFLRVFQQPNGVDLGVITTAA
jgi:hypothetical protein